MTEKGKTREKWRRAGVSAYRRFGNARGPNELRRSIVLYDRRSARRVVDRLLRSTARRRRTLLRRRDEIRAASPADDLADAGGDCFAVDRLNQAALNFGKSLAH